MGSAMSSLFPLVSDKREYRILMIGLDAAGSTTILYCLKLGEVFTTVPTIGFNVETIEHKNISFTVWDIGAPGNKFISMLGHYYKGTDALVFVVDSNDRDRFAYAKHTLEMILSADEMKDKPTLVFANKQDLPGAMGVETIADQLDLQGLCKNQWYVQPCSATSGIGLYEGLDWFSTTLQKRMKL